MEKLLLFLSLYANPQKDVIAATLAWLAKDSGLSFEIYYESDHSGKHFSPTSKADHFGSTVLGGFHHERFYFLNTLFDVEYVIYGQPKIFSSSVLKRIRAKIIVETKDAFELYRKVFSHFNLQLPKEAVIVENSLSQGKDTIEVSPYCYPEIFYRRALGIGSNMLNANLSEIPVTNDLTNVYTLFLTDREIENLRNQDFNVVVVDKFRQTDTYWSISSRIAGRWLKNSRGIAYCDPVLASSWLPWLCRHNRLAVYEVSMDSVRGQLKDLVLTTRNNVLYGRQSRDRDITELSKSNIMFQITDPNRPLFPVIEEADYQMYRPTKSYYKFEPNDNTLETYARERKILCTILFYCPDIRHVEGLPYILNLVALTKMKIGLGITAQWYKLVPEILEMINVPIENGGVFPKVEPLLCSTGMGVGIEAEGFLRKDTLREHLKEAKEIISKVAGVGCLPKGYYPFLDTTRDYPYSESTLKCMKDRGPSFEAVMESGFDYALSYASPGRPKVVYKTDEFIAINLVKKWFPYSPFIVISSPRQIKIMEIGLTLKRKPGWIVITLDSPLWLFSYHRWEKSNKLLNMASYLSHGGLTGKLVNTTPHVISRYARILDDEGLI